MNEIVNVIVNRDNVAVENHAFYGKKDEIAKKAEQVFIEVVKKYDSATEEEIQDALDDGIWEADDYTICLTWANWN